MSEKESSAIEVVIDYIKERIESPFLMSFLFSWSVINRDFLFYLFMSSDSNKHYQLANWDFSGFMVNFEDFSWYSHWADSFWWPLIVSVLMTLLFSPISMFLSGCRYAILSTVISFTQSRKDGFNKAHEIKLEEQRLKELQAKCSENEKNAQNWKEKEQFYRGEYDHSKNTYLNMKRGEVADFLIAAAKFTVLYKTGHYSEIDEIQVPTVRPNSRLKLSFFDKTETSKSLATFEGTTFEFITNADYFDWDDGDSLNQLYSLLTTLESNRSVLCDIKHLGRVSCTLIECISYHKSA